MSKLNHPDILVIFGLLLIGIGLHWLWPVATPYFILAIGLLMLALWVLVAKNGRRE